MKILGISGSLRAGSHNARLLRVAAGLLPPGAELEIFDGLGAVPPFNEDGEHTPPPAVVALKRAIADADAVLVSTPEYNHSIPGALKNALDWVSRPGPENPMRGKPALVIGASTGMFGAVWAQAETRKVLGALGARVVDEELPVAKAPDGLDDPRLAERLAELLGELVAGEALRRAA
jgi:chromate reductase, NAD(P)H dehydrogenase (quinone)